MAVTQEMPSLLEQDRRQLHPLHHPSQTDNPLIIEHAEGVWLYTTDGRKILDNNSKNDDQKITTENDVHAYYNKTNIQ